MTATKIHWARIAWTIALVGGFGAAEAQIGKQDRLPGLAPMVPSPFTTVPTTVPVHTVTIVPNPKLGLGRPLGQPVVLRHENGGSITVHQMRFFNYQRDGDRIEMRGPCWSACTLITAYVPKDKLCIAPGAFMAFHGAQTMTAQPVPVPAATKAMYRTYPAEIRHWIDAHGGVDALPGPNAGYWTLYDRDLWAMGYPRCP